MFAEHFISAGPKGSIANSREEFMKKAYQAADFYRKVGQTSAKILSMKEVPISKEYSMVHVHWGVTFKKTGNKPIEFDVTYFLQETGEEGGYLGNPHKKCPGHASKVLLGCCQAKMESNP